MPGVARKSGDAAGGTIISGSTNVYANGLAIARIGDGVAPHGLPPHASPTMAEGSNNVYVNGIAICRAGDAATCGHSATGSGNVIAN